MGTSEGRCKAACRRAARISARSRAISDEKFCGREKFSKFSVEIAAKSAAARHADARHSAWGPLRLVARLRSTNRQGIRRDLARIRTKNFAAAKKIQNFRSRSRRNPPRHSMPTLRTVLGDLCGSWQGCAPPIGRDFGAISRDFGRKILRPRKNFKIFGPRFTANRMQSHAPQHADPLHSACGP